VRSISTVAIVQAARRMLTGWAPFAAAVLVSFVVLFAPESATPSTLPPGIDKVIHLALFAALAWTGRRAGLPVVGLAVGLMLYAAGSEVLQGAAPDRAQPGPARRRDRHSRNRARICRRTRVGRSSAMTPTRTRSPARPPASPCGSGHFGPDGWALSASCSARPAAVQITLATSWGRSGVGGQTPVAD
jgi:hypothetical protein